MIINLLVSMYYLSYTINIIPYFFFFFSFSVYSAWTVPAFFCPFLRKYLKQKIYTNDQYCFFFITLMFDFLACFARFVFVLFTYVA